jgi:hypothetical protein
VKKKFTKFKFSIKKCENHKTYPTHGIFFSNIFLYLPAVAVCARIFFAKTRQNHQTISVANKISRIIGFHENWRKNKTLKIV